jgi:hypothetical protein
MLREFRELYLNCIRDDLDDVYILHCDLTCLLVQVAVNSTAAVDLSIFRNLFNVRRNPDQNADIFLRLGELVIATTTDLFMDDVRRRILQVYNLEINPALDVANLTPYLVPHQSECPLCQNKQAVPTHIIEGVVHAIYDDLNKFNVPPFEEYYTVTLYPLGRGHVKYLKFPTLDDLRDIPFQLHHRIRVGGCLHVIESKDLVFGVKFLE